MESFFPSYQVRFYSNQRWIWGQCFFLQINEKYMPTFFNESDSPVPLLCGAAWVLWAPDEDRVVLLGELFRGSGGCRPRGDMGDTARCRGGGRGGAARWEGDCRGDMVRCEECKGDAVRWKGGCLGDRTRCVEDETESTARWRKGDTCESTRWREGGGGEVVCGTDSRFPGKLEFLAPVPRNSNQVTFCSVKFRYKALWTSLHDVTLG